MSHALGWISRLPSPPFFVWIHLYDAHDPYDPPEPFKTRYASQPYDGEIAYVDSVLGKLFEELNRHGLLDETMIAVAADHGESLGAHGESTHGVFLYDETLHVPLLLKFPLNRSGGSRVESRVGLVDVAPTLLKEAGIAVPHEMQGASSFQTRSFRTGETSASSVKSRSEPEYPHRLHV